MVRVRRPLLVFLLVLTSILVAQWAPSPASAADAAMSIQKVASTTDVAPGDTFVYTIQVQCTTAVAAGCVGATVTDPLPDYVTLNGTISIVPAVSSTVSNGPPIVVDFTEPLSDGSTGLPAGRVYTITIPVILSTTIPPEQDGQDIVNTATIDADNADPRSNDATVVPDIDVTHAAATTKVIAPHSAIAGSTDPITLTVTGQNTSNVPVDELVIVDPLVPQAPPDTGLDDLITYIQLASDTPFTVTFPANATEVQVDVFDASTGEWVIGVPTTSTTPPIPGGVDPANVSGVRMTFTGDIQPGATATVVGTLIQRPGNADIVPPEGVTADNTARASVVDDGEETQGNIAQDFFSLRQSTIDVQAGKTIEPAIVHVGDPVLVTLTGENTSPDPLTTMTITEPSPISPPLPNPLSNGLDFTEIDTANVQWPAGADEITVIYSCGDSMTPSTPQTSTTVDDFPDPNCPAGEVTGFSATFTDTDGSGIPEGATAIIPFVATPTTNQVIDERTYLNTMQVHGTNDTGGEATDYASDTVRAIVDRIAIEVAKAVVPSTVPLNPGQVAIVALTGHVLPFPASTVDAEQIVVQDPMTLPEPPPPPPGFFDVFQPKSVTSTPVPLCSTLTVEYTTDLDGTTWTSVPGMVAIPGATVVNQAFPDDVVENATGIRFVYDDVDGPGCEGGFPPDTTVNPNLAFGMDPDFTSDDPVTITNCAGAFATAPALELFEESGPACDTITIVPGAGPGSLDPIDKTWDIPSVNERSQQQAGVTIGWGTAGYTGLDHTTVSDTADPSRAGLPTSAFDVFDLVRIDPITPSLDAFLTWDQITQVELYSLAEDDWFDAGDTTVWADAPADPCPGACDGTFPGYTLSAAQRADVIGFRLTYAESPTRAARLTATAPPVGTGVAAAPDNSRLIHPVFQIRDAKRSDPAFAVVASEIYNAGAAGVVNDTARGTGYFDPDEAVGFWDADDDIVILPIPVLAGTTKTWTGGPLGIPADGTPPELYPTSRVTLTGTNRTPAKVDRLTISDDTNNDPPISEDDPFEWFNVIGFNSITSPAAIGAMTVTITLDGATPSQYGPGGDEVIAEVLALTEEQLEDVTHIEVTYDGRINVGDPNPAAATATVVYDVQLRNGSRTDGTAPTADLSPVNNEVTTTVTDLVGYTNVDPESNSASANADMPLVPQGLDVVASKTIVPETITEPSTGPAAVTIGGQPSGPSRTVQMVLTDIDPHFWNQYDFATFSSLTFASPIDQVRVDAFTGGMWSVVGGEPVLTGGDWVEGDESTSTTLALPTGVDPAAVQGLRFTFTRADGANWENPANPNQTVTFNVTRRATLNTSGPVLPDVPGFAPAPGEPAPGVATNTMTADVTSSDVDVNGDPLTASDDATDTITFIHGRNAVRVVKGPNGTQVSPGAPLTYSLTSTNVGDIDIVDPVITDYLPTDADGPQVTLATDPNFTYSITGGTGMPTNPDLVTVTATDSTLTFTFPEGSTLPIGAGYTITFDVELRPGLPAGTQFTNTFGIVDPDRPWDACDGRLDATTGECEADATNTVLSAGAVSIVKQVRGEGSDELGTILDPTGFPVDCAPDADGFYSRPCVPIAAPGGDITWRFHVVNTGNRPIDRLLTIDSLPAVGDTLATSPTIVRGSEWRPLLTGERPTGADPSSGTLNVWFTTGESTCDSPFAADGALLCSSLPWQVWPAGSTLPVDPEAVTGLQFEMLPADGTLFEPAATFDVDIPMVAPPYDPDAAIGAPQQQPDKVAYNTVGVAARWIDPANQATGYTLTTEPQRVGVALANGPLGVLKLVTGDAAQFAPDEFEMTLSCVSAGVDVPLPDDVAVFDPPLTAGELRTINNLPWGATCTLTEGDNGQTSTDTSSATVVVTQEGQELAVATVTNVYDVVPLTVVKTLDSAAVDQDGNPIPYGPFVIGVQCEFDNGEETMDVYAEGYGILHPMIAEFDAGESVTFDGLPSGASCSITELDDKGAASTTITTQVGDGDPTTEDGTETIVELAGDSATVTVTNTFTVGSIAVVKVVDGAGAATYGAGPFTISVVCQLDDQTGSRVVFDDDIVLGGGAPLSATIVDLPTGAACQFVEIDDHGATSSALSPANGILVVGADTTATLTVTNSFQVGSVAVTKVVTGAGAATYGAGPFTISATCVYEGTTLYNTPIVLGGGGPLTQTIDNLPTGTSCQFAETVNGGATTSSISPSDGIVVVGNGTIATFTATNTFSTGSIQITKVVSGSDAGMGTGPFTVAVTCTAAGTGQVAWSGNATFGGGQPMTTTIDNLPTGAHCTFSETNNGGASSSTISPAEGVVVGDGTVATVTVTNVFESELPATGGDSLRTIRLALLGLGVGALLVLLARRRRYGRRAV